MRIIISSKGALKIPISSKAEFIAKECAFLTF